MLTSTKPLRQIGNSYGLLIDRPICNLLGIKPGTPLRLTSDGRGLLITPARPPRPRKPCRGREGRYR